MSPSGYARHTSSQVFLLGELLHGTDHRLPKEGDPDIEDRGVRMPFSPSVVSLSGS